MRGKKKLHATIKKNKIKKKIKLELYFLTTEIYI